MNLKGLISYKVQINDNKGLPASDIHFGGVYGYLTPKENVVEAAGEWQTYDMTLIGRLVSIIANGKIIISNQNIPGMTGSALDNDETAPRPILIQGYHWPIEFKSIEITPIAQ